MLTLELGYDLVHMVDPARGGTLLDRVIGLRRDLAQECGLVVPPIHVCDNLDLPSSSYRLLLLGNEVGRAECRSGRVLAIDASGYAPPIDGEETKEPAFGLRAVWVLTRDKEMAEALGYATVDHSTLVATHLGEMLRNFAGRLLGRQEAQHLLDVLAKVAPKLVDDVVPNLLPLGDVVRVLRNLLNERLSIRDLRTIMEALADAAHQTKDPEQLTELVRERLAPSITARLIGADRSVNVLALDPRIEDTLRRTLREIASGAGGGIDPELIRVLGEKVEASLAKFSALGAPPVLVAPPDVRRFVRAIFERKVPQLSVVSFREIEPSVSLRVVETLSLPVTNGLPAATRTA